MKNSISISKFLLVGLIVAALAGGGYVGFYYTSQHYEAKESAKLAQEEETDRKNLIC